MGNTDRWDGFKVVRTLCDGGSEHEGFFTFDSVPWASY